MLTLQLPNEMLANISDYTIFTYMVIAQFATNLVSRPFSKPEGINQLYNGRKHCLTTKHLAACSISTLL